MRGRRSESFADLGSFATMRRAVLNLRPADYERARHYGRARALPVSPSSSPIKAAATTSAGWLNLCCADNHVRAASHASSVSEATAIVGIIVAGVAGPAVTAVLANWRQVNQQRHERAREDLADLRALLADAAKDLRWAEGLISGTLSLLLTWGEQINVRASSHINKSSEAGRTVMFNDARIAIRLDDTDPIAEAHRDAARAVEKAAGALGRVGGLGGANLSDTNNELNAAQTDLAAARAWFAEAARREVGSANVAPSSRRGRRIRWLRKRRWRKRR
jgi:hypothetical protein